MKHWVETYPHKVYTSVLLLNNEIIDYFIGEHYWKTPYNVTLRGEINYKDLSKCETRYVSWEVNNSKEHCEVFEKLAKEWINNQIKGEK
ncbi:hypothetical protein ACV3OO_11785 [Clostridium perfringens]